MSPRVKCANVKSAQGQSSALFLVIAVASLLAACAPVDVGPDFSEIDAGPPAPPPSTDAGSTPTPPSTSDASIPSGPRAPLDPNFFFCRIQPEVYRPHRCASARGCHSTDSALRLDPSPEVQPPLPCANGVPQAPVPAAYYTNLARSRTEVRGSATRSDLYRRPLGPGHPVTLYSASSIEAELVRAWIEGAQ